VSSNLHIEVQGCGPDLVLLHGWSFSHVVWLDLAEALADKFTLHLVDLPGHGQSDLPAAGFTLEAVTAMLAQQLPVKAMYLGWSLGGQIALNLALNHPERVEKLILVASNAQFVKSADWPDAMDPAVLVGFAENLEQDWQATLQRFLALQARGGDNARDTIKLLRSRLEGQGAPQMAALRGGLEILRSASLLPRLAELRCPSLLFSGRLDALVPKGAGPAMQVRIPGAQHVQFEHAAHAPFLSHPQEFLQVVQSFLESEHAG